MPSLTLATVAMSFADLGWPMMCDAMYIHTATMDKGDRPASRPNLSILSAILTATLELR